MKFHDFFEGQTYEQKIRITDAMVKGFADLVGDQNPIHLDEDYAKQTRFGQRIAHGMLVASIISKILGCDFPGPGTIYLSQSVQFRGPVSIDQEILYRFAVLEKNDEKRRLKIETNVTDLEGISLVLGEALVMVL